MANAKQRRLRKLLTREAQKSSSYIHMAPAGSSGGRSVRTTIKKDAHVFPKHSGSKPYKAGEAYGGKTNVGDPGKGK